MCATSPSELRRGTHRSVRILFDARSVRTTTGSYVFRGLTSSWREDQRVGEVLAAIPPEFDGWRLPEGVAPVRLPANGGWLRHVLISLARAADRVRADVIFCANATGPRDGRAVLYFQDLFHFRYRDADVPLRSRVLETARATWRSFAAVRTGLGVAVSRVIAEEAKQDVHGLAIVEIPNGVEVGAARWTGEEDAVYVAGGTGFHKSEEIAVRAWARLKHRRPSTVLQIGGVEPAARRAELQRMANDFDLGDSVAIRGALPREAYLERIARARLTVVCSQFESFGLPVAEALAMGAPVLCSDIAAHRELLARAGAGESFPARDDAALAARLSRVLDGGMPQRLASAPAGWDWKTRAREHIDAYQRHLHL